MREQLSDAFFRALYERSLAPVLIIDPLTGTILDANPAAAAYYGYAREELCRLRVSDLNQAPEATIRQEIERAARERRNQFFFRHRLASGEVRDVEVLSMPVCGGERPLLASVIHDITDHNRMRAALEASERRFRALFECAPIGIELADKHGHLTHTNAALQRMLGYGADELQNIDFADITHPDDLAAEQALDDEMIAGRRTSYQLEKRHIHKDGNAIWTRLTASLVAGDDPDQRFAIGMVEDITDRRQAQEALQYQALHDALTGLPNRALLHDRLDQALLLARRDQSGAALLLLDLDRFKEINDTFGHACGDLLLRQCALRLRQAVRASDTVARLGGDEFALILPEADREGAAKVAATIGGALAEPFKLEGHSLYVAASIGVALAPEHSGDGETLLRQADVAMYAAKRDGSNWAIYSPADDPHSPDRLSLIEELRRAIEHGGLVLHFQPKLDLATRRIEGVEALVRWPHPTRGMIRPDQFIGLAEQTGLIRPLTYWVLSTALEQCRRWRAQGLNLRVAVNLSPRMLADPDLAAHVASRLQSAGVQPNCLELEITENAIMADATRVIETLRRLHAMGILISLDDFGTGYSSLAHLRHLPVDEIKIDKSFVIGLDGAADDVFIARSVIDLGHNLGLKVVAEGVETQETLDRLTALGCDRVQGYHLSRPLPATDLAGWFAALPSIGGGTMVLPGAETGDSVA